MDIVEPKARREFDDGLKTLMKLLKFKKYKVDLKGSASLTSQRYYSDYDLFTNITDAQTASAAFKEFSRILGRVLDRPDVYFIELKLQTKDGHKVRWYPGERFEEKRFGSRWEQVDYVKLDVIAFIKNRFIEVSCLYGFSNTPLTPAEYIANLQKDITELKKEHRYYKILKRLFNIYRAEGNKKNLLTLNRVFNSHLGELYQRASNLEAIEQVKESYPDEETARRIAVNLADIKEPAGVAINPLVDKYMAQINKEAKVIYNKLTA
jgi:hypothetical protein